jgi:anthranilate synthase component 1
MKYKLKIREKQFLADTITPVGAYLKLRDRFANSLLLESSDYHGEENSFSYICCQPLATFEVSKQSMTIQWPDSTFEKKKSERVLEGLKEFASSFEFQKKAVKHIQTGLFGYMSYDAVRHFEDIEVQPTNETIPEIRYALFKYVIAFDHFRNQCYVIETFLENQDDLVFDEIIDILHKQSTPRFKFERIGDSVSDIEDDDFLQMVKKGIHHCDIGDVFQVVFSRKFSAAFKGDEFQVYRALRSINPSPYLFYFDFGSYKIFGSSPEAQIVINPEEAVIYPIAGTFRRTGDDQADAELAKKLLEDEKENSEHIMLVDLARNDLSRYTSDVQVETYKEIQYYSHVIHLVSKVTGKMPANANMLDIVASTFPAGTLSGAPKYRAMELIAENENSGRGFYGGAIGFMDFSGSFNHAIAIRTFLSHKNTLFFRAGAGIVAKSQPENEVQEVYNKLAALETAMDAAEKNTK